MTTDNNSSILKDVVAYVDVWSSDKTANCSKPFIQQLQEMGAQISKAFSKQVTHVVFNNGHPATWRKAKKSDVKLVSVLWVGRCYDDGARVDEDLYPAVDETNPVTKNKKHRCMQPKDSPERTPDNDRRMRKKLDKLMKNVLPKQPLVTDLSPIIIDEENGIVYSPGLKRSDYMAQRLKDMKEKHENLSPTASQLVQSCSPTGLKPSLGSTPTVLKFMYDRSDDDSSASAAEPAFVPDEEEGRTCRDVTDHTHGEQRHKKTNERPWLSPCRDVPNRISSSLKFSDLTDREEEDNSKPKKSRRTLIKDKPAEKTLGLLESACQDRRSDSNVKTGKRRSQIKSLSPSPQKSENRKGKIKAPKSFTETKSHFLPDTVNSSSCVSSPAKLGDAAAKLSKVASASSQKLERKTPKQARLSLSSLVRSFTLSSDSKNVASGSTDGDDNVFEDYFSPGNFHHKSNKLLLPNAPVERDIQVPFEFGSVEKKRKQRRSESTGAETSSKKKKKLEETQTGKTPDQQSNASTEPQSHPQQDVKESLDSPSTNVRVLAKKRRQSTLPFRSTGSTSDAVKQRRSTTSVLSNTLESE